MAGSKGSSCAVPGCDGKVMSDERGLDILPCECDFKICRDCYVDAVKTGNGICPGCKEPYHNTDLDELARDSGRPLPLPPPGAGGISLSRDDLDSEIGSGEFMNYERSGRIPKSVQLRSGFLGRLNDEEDDDPFAEEHKRAKFNTSTVLQWLSLYLILGALLSTLTTQLLVFISSQLLLVAFMLRNTCKTVFEGIFFLFVMHPFDVGDLCEIEGVQMIVEEMNILDTVFLSFDNQKIIYPNNVLSTKPIRKFLLL